METTTLNTIRELYDESRDTKDYTTDIKEIKSISDSEFILIDVSDNVYIVDIDACEIAELTY